VNQEIEEVDVATRKKRPKKLKVYLMDDGYAFIRDPLLHGKWLRVLKCIALYGCPVCKAKTGETCRTRDGKPWNGESHHQRRTKALRLPPNLRGATVVE